MLYVLSHRSGTRRAVPAVPALSVAAFLVVAPQVVWSQAPVERCEAPPGAVESAPPRELDGAAAAEPVSVLAYQLRHGILGSAPASGGAAAQFDVRGSAPSGTTERGAVFNYDLVWQRSSDVDRGHAGAAVQFGTYGDGLKTRHAMVHPAAADAEWTRLDSWVQLDEPRSDRVVRLGDAVTSPGSTGRARRFAGVQWATERGNDTLADARFMPQVQPLSRDSGDVPRTLDVLMSQARDRVVPADAGPDQLRRLPALFGNGDVLLAATDLLGRAQWLSVPLFVAPGLLPSGTSNYSASLGFERLSYGALSNDYGTPLAQAYWRQGLTPQVTGELRLEGDAGSGALAASGSSALGRVGVLTLNAAQLRDAAQSYEAYGASIDHRTGSLGLAAGANWRNAAATAAPLEATGALPPRRELLARASYDLAGVALAAGGVLREHDDDTRDSLWSASLSTRFLDDGKLALSAVHARLGAPNRSLFVTISMPLGPRAPARPLGSTAAGRLDLSGRSERIDTGP